MTTPNLKNLAVSSTGFVFDPRSGATFTVNPTGLAILVALRDGASIDEVVDQIGDTFEGAPRSARDDVLDFLQALRAHGLVSAERAP